MALPDSFVEEVRRSADIVALVSEHVSLRRVGGSWKGLCPFHQEKGPSFNVRSEPPVFHCFGCGVGGDVFKFLMLREGVSFPEAVESLARRYGVAIPERVAGDGGRGRREREQLLELLEAAAAHYQSALWSPAGEPARRYLKGRGFERETLERIRAGAARDAWRDVLGALQGRFGVERLQEAGLVLQRQQGDGHYDRFRNRVVFPILNESGRVVGFGARSLDGSEPKYLNSPETPAYQKSRVLYGLSWAREAARREGRLILMEGYLDVARALERGVPEVVATCGTALTPSHARLLRRVAPRAVLSFDCDEAGQRAAERSGELLLGEGLEVRVLQLPEGDDPDSFLREHGGDAYRALVEAAPHYVEWRADRAARECDVSTPPGKAAYLKVLIPALQRLESAVERAAWIPVIAERGGLDPAAAALELRRALGGRGGPAATALPAAPRRERLLPAERLLLTLILRGASGVDDALGELSEADLEELASAPVLRSARAVYLRGEPVSAAAISGDLEDEGARRLVNETAVESIPTERVSPLDCVRELRGRRIEARIAEIGKAVASARADALDALLHEQLELKQRLADLTRAQQHGSAGH